jgi:hypothetical protein
MMALYDRFRGWDDNEKEVVKLPIWPTITSFTEILAGEQTDAGVIARFNLDAGEQAEFAQVKIKINTDITNLATSLITAGVDADAAAQIAKGVIRNDISQILMRAELDYCTRSEFNTVLGIA